MGGKGSVVLLDSSTSISFALFYFIFMLPRWMVAPGARYYFNTYSAGVPSEPSQAGNVMSTECGPLIGQRETTYFTILLKESWQQRLCLFIIREVDKEHS